MVDVLLIPDDDTLESLVPRSPTLAAYVCAGAYYLMCRRNSSRTDCTGYFPRS